MQDLLKHKIEELFEYRAFPELYRLSGGSAATIKKLHSQLVELQARIYELDAYLEQNWDLKASELQRCWTKIYASLDRLGVPPSQHFNYCGQIHKYQKHETDLRYNRMPTRLDMEYFYFYKSCDVKLQRRLLIEKFPKLKSMFTSADWRYFDLVTEVNDDATDLEEDTTTINGNRLLISFLTLGKSATHETFFSFLDYAVKQSKHRFGGKQVSSFHKNIHYRTLEQAEATRVIIDNAPMAIISGRKELPFQHYLKLDVRA